MANGVQKQLLEVTSRTVDKIREMNPALADELRPTVKFKNWDTLFNVSLAGDDGIPMNKRGSGTRRLVLLNFFRAMAEDASIVRNTGVIYAIEEPETSQHPDHQRMLLEAFEQLVENGNCQVILTTHTSMLARRLPQSSLKLISRDDQGEPLVEDGSLDGTLPKIVRTLGALPDHDVKLFIGVEGKHDISFLKLISANLAAVEPDIPDLANAEAAGHLVFVPLGGSSLELWLTRLQGFNRPEFYLTDRDDAPPAPPKYQQYVDGWLARGCTAWITSKRELENYLHPSILLAAVPTYGGVGADFEDVPMLFAEAVHTSAPGAPPWATVTAENKKSKASYAKRRLNNEFAALVTPDLLTAADTTHEIRGWLRTLRPVLGT